jgi:hypothetical protein
MSDHSYTDMAGVTNETNATNYYYLDMRGYQNAAVQIEIGTASDTITVTAEITLQDDGTAAASCEYQDITSAAFGISSATADDIWWFDSDIGARYIRIKTVSSGGNHDGDYNLYGWRGV